MERAGRRARLPECLTLALREPGYQMLREVPKSELQSFVYNAGILGVDGARYDDKRGVYEYFICFKFLFRIMYLLNVQLRYERPVCSWEWEDTTSLLFKLSPYH
jgi:hypothetical protein